MIRVTIDSTAARSVATSALSTARVSFSALLQFAFTVKSLALVLSTDVCLKSDNNGLQNSEEQPTMLALVALLVLVALSAVDARRHHGHHGGSGNYDWDFILYVER